MYDLTITQAAARGNLAGSSPSGHTVPDRTARKPERGKPGGQTRGQRQRSQRIASADPEFHAVTFSPDGRRVDGMLQTEGHAYFVCLSYERRTREARMWGQVAYAPSWATAAVGTLPVRAEHTTCRWSHHPDLGGLLTVEVVCGHTGRTLGDSKVEKLVNGFSALLQHPAVTSFLQQPGVRTLSRDADDWDW